MPDYMNVPWGGMLYNFEDLTKTSSGDDYFDWLQNLIPMSPVSGLDFTETFNNINNLQSNILSDLTSLINLDWSNFVDNGGTKVNPTNPKPKNYTKVGNIMGWVGAGADLLSSFLPLKTEYAGPKGAITKGIDAGYDAISDIAMNFGPVGAIVGGAMKANKLLGLGMNALGAGTDAMTTGDSILGSAFFASNIGAINGALGSRADTITMDEDAFETVGASYTGTYSAVNDALQKSGKKYGLISQGAKRKANEEIAEANKQQAIMADIADEATNRFAIRNSSTVYNTNRRAFNMQGGYQLLNIHAARLGMKFLYLDNARNIIKALKGKKLELTNDNTKVAEFINIKVDPFDLFVATLPDNQKPTEDYNVRRYWELNRKPKSFEEAIKLGMYTKERDGYHANTVAYNKATDEYEFMKSVKHPTLQYELDWYNSNKPDAIEFKNKYDLDKSGEYYKYVRRKTPIHKNGGEINVIPSYIEPICESIIELVSPLELIEEYKNGGTLNNISYIELVNPNDIEDEIELFKNGGEINVIPDGALHARKHNLDIEGITKKGIPVISEDENGNIELHAEIEREEIILRKSVTELIEDALKKYYSNEITESDKDLLALEIGKLLVLEILYNTKDNANLIETV